MEAAISLKMSLAALVTSLVLVLSPAAAFSQTWKDAVNEVRVGFVSGEDFERTDSLEGYRKLLADHLGVPVRIYPAADFKSLIQAHARGDVHVGHYTAPAYAAAWLGCQCVEPLVAAKDADGSRGFVSVMLVRN